MDKVVGPLAHVPEGPTVKPTIAHFSLRRDPNSNALKLDAQTNTRFHLDVSLEPGNVVFLETKYGLVKLDLECAHE